MPLTGSDAVLSAQLVAAVRANDSASTEAWRRWSSALLAHIVAKARVQPGSLVASGTTVTGIGTVSWASGDGDGELGDAWVEAARTSDEANAAAFTRLATALRSWIKDHAQVLPTSFVVVTTGGPVTGTGTLSFSASTTLGAALREAAKSPDDASIASWNALGDAIAQHLANHALVLPLPIDFKSPPYGGALTGQGTLQ